MSGLLSTIIIQTLIGSKALLSHGSQTACLNSTAYHMCILTVMLVVGTSNQTGMCQEECKKKYKQDINFLKTSQTTTVRDNNGDRKTAEISCRWALFKRSGIPATGKYLWSCHGTRPQLQILFKQSVSRHREGDRHCIIKSPTRTLLQYHTLSSV